ncbi:hypothetical protein FisN_13Lh004 [Fistulifera solaris]|uniref:Uncharacterized protein n=1 Tax=Fistulifera solaris TaxID=1519565 RepID=A0A1Z5JF79_FISSO|nr:hypothetical protein FisN_13Lh004 [Fistulifera solaris]|eukprot:GAX12552.1 hypothetical protein FisN_13Lh004 [Fistulifera solaris]
MSCSSWLRLLSFVCYCCFFWLQSPSTASLAFISSHNNIHRKRSASPLRQEPHQQEENIQVSDAPKECPYSMRFSPQRINLTRPKQLPRKKILGLTSFFPGRRSRFEQTISCERLEWCKETDGLALLARLFHTAATATENNLVMAFPDASAYSLLQNAVEILGPYATQWDLQMIWEPLPHIKFNKTVNSDAANNNQHDRAWIDNETHQRRTQEWVQRLLVTHGICPYTRTNTKSGQGIPGVPVALIAYSATPATSLLELVSVSLTKIQHDMLDVGPEKTSSILLAAPEFDNRFEEWSALFFSILQACIVAVSLTDTIGVVCFHPEYKVSDGQTWPGFGHMHSVPKLQQLTDIDLWNEAAAGGAWQRRTPHATLNVLWAPQLALAEKQRKTTSLYRENIRKLVHGIGVEKLQQDLEQERRLFKVVE